MNNLIATTTATRMLGVLHLPFSNDKIRKIEMAMTAIKQLLDISVYKYIYMFIVLNSSSLAD